MQSLNLSKTDREKLMSKLPKKWSITLGSKFKCHPSHVRLVLKGDRVNDQILIEAIKMAAKTEKERAKNTLLAQEVINGD